MAERTRSLRWMAMLCAIAAGLAVAGRVVRRYEIAELSMAPALKPGDWVIATHRSPVFTHRGPPVGRVVVFPHPLRPGFELVKRVVARSGQEVSIVDGRVLVDEQPLDEQPYGRWIHGTPGPNREWVVPDRSVLLLGDAMSVSRDDSRDIGPVPLEAASWQVIVRYWPPRRAGRAGL